MKMIQPTDRISYIKIQLSSIKNTEVVIDPDSIRLSKNIINSYKVIYTLTLNFYKCN